MNKLYIGDNVKVLKEHVSDEAIDLTVTSPPYDDLRTYNGFEWDFEAVAKELYRVTKDGGVVVWVVGDATVNGDESGTSFRQALFFKEIGFNLLDTMIYEKAGGGARGSKYCYTQSFDYMFVFTKGRQNVLNPIMKDNVTKPCRDTTASRSKYGLITTRRITYGKQSKRNNIWRYSNAYGRSSADLFVHEHPAIFPEQLAEDHIISWSNEGDVVLDLFGGSGTTAKMAALNNRKFIHIDISEEYVKEVASVRLERHDIEHEIKEAEK